MWLRFVKRSALLAKDLALPFVLVLLGYLFQKRQAKRDKEYQDSQKERQERQEVRNIILPFVHALVEKHYMPIVRSSLVLIIDAGRWIEEKESTLLELCFFDFVVFLKRMAYLRNDKGQVFFQHRKAEAIASNVWSIARDQFQSVLGEEGISKLTMICTPKSAAATPNGGKNLRSF